MSETYENRCSEIAITLTEDMKEISRNFCFGKKNIEHTMVTKVLAEWLDDRAMELMTIASQLERNGFTFPQESGIVHYSFREIHEEKISVLDTELQTRGEHYVEKDRYSRLEIPFSGNVQWKNDL